MQWSKHPEKNIVVDLRCSFIMSSLIQSLKRGFKIGEELFASSSRSSYRSSYLSVDIMGNGNVISDRRGVSNFHFLYHMVVKNNQMNQTMRLKTIFLIMRTKSWLIAPLRLEFMERSRTIGLP